MTGSDCLYAYGFRFYFTPLSGVLFAFPSRYWFTIGRQGVFSLGGWSPHVQTGFHVSRPTRFHPSPVFVYRTITFYGWTFQTIQLTKVTGLRANPRSLAATRGISVDFFSSGYLDVSVHQVRLNNLWIQLLITSKGWVSPFGNPRIKASLSAPRGLSQTTTSFIASCRQGIHHMRLTA